MRKVAVFLFFMFLLNLTFVMASEQSSFVLDRTESLQKPDIFSNVHDYTRYYYSSGNDVVSLDVLEFQSDKDLLENINRTIEDVDLKKTFEINGKKYFVFSKSIEWISNNKLIHIESEKDILSLTATDFFNNLSELYPSSLENIIPIEDHSFSTRSFSIQSTSLCDECGAGLFNICDQSECWSLGSVCYSENILGVTSCYDGSLLSNGNDDYCLYKDQRFGGCLRNEYDCDSSNQCLAGLSCVGSLTGEDGCCNVDEEWDVVNHRCKQDSDFQTNLNYTYGNIKYGLYRGKWEQGPICVTCPAHVWHPEEIDYSKRPVLLIHGWSNDAESIENNPSNEWGNLQQTLESKGYQVWRLQYAPANMSNKNNAGMIADAIQNLLSYGYDQNYNQIDVVSHSMGGLGVRGYVQGIGVDKNGNVVPYGNDIRKYVIISSPMYGSYFANIIDGISETHILPNHPACQELIELKKLYGNSEATRDMEIGSDYTWEINNKPINTNVDYLTITGTRTMDRALPTSPHQDFDYCLSNWMELNDGVVSVQSSNLIGSGYPMIVLDKFHSSIKFFGLNIEEGIDDSAKVGNIIDLFLKNTLTKNSVTPFLDKNAFHEEAYYHPAQSSDPLPFELVNNGAVIIQINKSEINLNSNSLKLNHTINPTLGISDLVDLERNSITGRWFYNNIDEISNSRIHFSNLLVNIGTYKPVVNGHMLNNIINIHQARVNLVTLNLDNDSDGFDLKEVGGTDCNDSNININPQSTEMCNQIDDNCDNDVDEGYDKGSSCFIGIGECRGVGIQVCTLNGIGTVCNAIELNPTNEICDDKDNNCNGQIDENNVCSNLFNLHLISPVNKVYNERSIPLNLTIDEMVDKITYKDILGSNREINLCKDCTGYGNDKRKVASFSDGQHNLTFRAIKNNSIVSEVNVSFFVDSKDPSISSTKPQNRKYTNGSNFYIKYSEDNCQSIQLLIGNSQQNLGSCDSNRNVEKSFSQNVSSFDGQEIQYKFTIIDIANNTDESRLTAVKVDTTSPVISNLQSLVIARSVSFNMTILNENKDTFDIVEYIDNSDSNPRWRTLCSSLKNNICFKKVSFKTGNHNIVIRAIDNAGNSVKRTMEFMII